MKEISKHKPKPSLDNLSSFDAFEEREKSINICLTSPSFQSKQEIKRQQSVTSVKDIRPLHPIQVKMETEASKEKGFLISEIDSGTKSAFPKTSGPDEDLSAMTAVRNAAHSFLKSLTVLKQYTAGNEMSLKTKKQPTFKSTTSTRTVPKERPSIS